MKPQVREIIGQRITGVIVKHAKDSHHRPSSMLILVFEDGTNYEFYTHAGRLRPHQLWKLHDVDQLHSWGEDQLWTELIAWHDDDDEIRVRQMSDAGVLHDV
ncbi:MAG TPA: hypothetical protein VGH91_12150 [Gammaproteobacteria bacterium]|jgi:hypothetical protein